MKMTPLFATGFLAMTTLAPFSAANPSFVASPAFVSPALVSPARPQTPASSPAVDDSQAKKIQDLEKKLAEMQKALESLQSQQAKAPAQNDLDRALADLASRIEPRQGATSKQGANVMAPNVTSIKITFEDRFRAEYIRNRAFGAVKDDTAGGNPNTLVTSVSPVAPTGTVTPGIIGGAGQNEALGDATRFLNRLRMNMDVDVNPNLGAFFQLQYSTTWGASIGGGTAAGGSLLPNQPITPFVAPIAPGALATQDQLAAGAGAIGFKQAYVVFKDMFSSHVNMSVGRFNLDLGQGRLLSSADWDNVGRSFDGLKFEYGEDQWAFTGFATKVVEGGLDFQAQDTELYGGYVAISPVDGFTLTPYVMFVDNNSTPDSVTTVPPLVTATVPYMVGKPLTLGSLIDFKIQDSGIRLYGEGAVQRDHSRPNTPIQGGQNIDFKEAYAYAIGATYTLNLDETKGYDPSVGVEQGRATKYFNDLYSAAHGNYGMGDFVSTWNNLNYWKFSASTIPYPDQKVKLDLAYYFFRDANGVLGSAKTIGQEFDIALKSECTDHVTAGIGWAHFFNDKAFQGGGFVPGALYATTVGVGSGAGTREDADFFYISIALKF